MIKMKKTVLSLLFTIMTLFFPASVMGASASITDIKVAYIYNFVRYTSWPQSDEKSELFHICVHKDSDLRQSLQKLESKTVKGRAVKIIVVDSSTQSLPSCGVLVLSELEKEELNKVVAYATSHKMLTISDTQGYAELGVMINMGLQENKVTFEINLDKVKNSGLTISSQLLKLATIVQSKEI